MIMFENALPKQAEAQAGTMELLRDGTFSIRMLPPSRQFLLRLLWGKRRKTKFGGAA
jgi:hypothetical protein